MTNQASNQLPPKLAEKLLTWFLKGELAEEVLGDLDEKYVTTVEKKSNFKARINYWYQVLNYLRPFAIRKSKSKTSNHTIMFRNYLFIAFRNLSKNRFHSSINILSLALGIASCIVIYLFISQERLFDAQHTKSKDLYRLCEIQSFPGTNTQKVALSMPGMGPAMIKDFPEVESYTRYWGAANRLWENGDNRLIIDMAARVDSTFLDIFDFPLIMGDRTNALDEPKSIVISRETANKFFGKIDVVGETLETFGEELKITGVMEDIPEASHLQFDILVSISTFYREGEDFNNQWGSNFMVTYLKLVPNSNTNKMKKMFPEYLVRNSGDENLNDVMELFLQPFDQVHLGSMEIEHDYQNYRKFNGKYLDIFTLVGFFILIIASVNFMNLTTARASTRAKEVGVRKTVGARKNQLFWQFIVESVLLAFSALFFGLLINILTMPFLNDLIGRNLSLIPILFDPLVLTTVLISVLAIGILTGLYPSIYLSSFSTVSILKGIKSNEKKSVFRSSLIVIQFSLALAMIVATLVVLQQLDFMKNKDIGFNKDHVLLVGLNDTANDKFDLIKEKLNQNNNILGVTASGQRLGENFHQWGFQAKVDTGIVDLSPSNVYVDFDYLDVYGIELVKGRSFSKDFATDDGLAFVINESFAKELGYDEPIGQSVGHGWYPSDSLGTIIGVTKDFNFNSLHYKVNTLSMVVHTAWNYDEMSVKLNGKNIESGIKEVEKIWKEHVPDYPFEYSFLDDHFDELYRTDQQMGSVISIIAILSILIGAMGLFGLASISIKRRIKEIGIRKVLGAGKGQLVIILSSHFAKLIAVSFIIAAPLTYFVLGEWLDSFAFRIELNFLIFLIAGLSTFLIAMLTISYHTLRAASSNPTENLRYE